MFLKILKVDLGAKFSAYGATCFKNLASSSSSFFLGALLLGILRVATFLSILKSSNSLHLMHVSFN